jgi:hypothetical protein
MSLEEELERDSRPIRAFSSPEERLLESVGGRKRARLGRRPESRRLREDRKRSKRENRGGS